MNSSQENPSIHSRSEAEIELYNVTHQVSGLIDLCRELEKTVESYRQNLALRQEFHNQLVAAEKDAAEWRAIASRLASWAENDLDILEAYPTGDAGVKADRRRVWANSANTWLYPGDAVFQGGIDALKAILLEFSAKNASNPTAMSKTESDLPVAPSDSSTDRIKRAVRVLIKHDFGGTNGWNDECEMAAMELRHLVCGQD